MRSLFGYGTSAEHAARQRLIVQPVGPGQRFTEGHPVFTVQLGDHTVPASGLPGTHYSGPAGRFDVPATFFIRTTYVTDFNDAAFFDESRIDVLALIRDAGMDIAGHTVSHSNELQGMPIGTGTEQYPAYRPFVHDFTTVRDVASIAGSHRPSVQIQHHRERSAHSPAVSADARLRRDGRRSAIDEPVSTHRSCRRHSIDRV